MLVTQTELYQYIKKKTLQNVMAFHKTYQMRIKLLAKCMIPFMSRKTDDHWHWYYEEKYLSEVTSDD